MHELDLGHPARGIDSIDSRTFYGCESLASVTLPEGLTSIGDEAFSSCESLASITLPEGLQRIGDQAFMYCMSLSSVSLPASLTDLGGGAFVYCLALNSIQVAEGSPAYRSQDGVLLDREGTTLIICPPGKQGAFDIPAGVTTIEPMAFAICMGLTSVGIPEGVTTIGDQTFVACISLASITLPEGVTYIGEYAFSMCSALASITLPGSVTYIGAEAFGETAFYNDDSNWTDGVLYIGPYLIKADADIVSSSYTVKPGTKVIAGEAFMYCTGLTAIDLPEGLVDIGESAFASTKITAIDLPAGLTCIRDRAFQYCQLTSITLPEGVTSIGNEAFYGNNYMDSIGLPSTLESIGDYAFTNSYALTSIILPEKLTSIGDWAFANSRALQEMWVLAAVPPAITDETFKDIDTSIPVHVPAASLDSYRAADHWNAFTNYLPIGTGPGTGIATPTLADGIAITDGEVTFPPG